MALRRANYIGTDNICTGFETLNPDAKYFYSIWLSNDDIGFQCLSDDPGQQKQMLADYIGALEKSGNTDLMYLKCHPGDLAGYITKKTPVISVTPVQACGAEELQIIGGTVEKPNGMNYSAWEMMKALKDLPATLDEKINTIVDAKLQAIEEDEEDEPESVAMQTIGVIKGVMNDPGIMAILSQLINLFKPQTTTMGGQINGVQETVTINENVSFDEELMNASLNRLRYHMNLDTDLNLLANLAESDPAQFKMLLNMLRAK